METILQLVTSTLMFVSSFLGYGHVSLEMTNKTVAPTSVELGLQEVSPKGAEGGFAIPASGCIALGTYVGIPGKKHPEDKGCPSGPEITVDKPIIRKGDQVIVSWDPKGSINCFLSDTVNVLTVSPNPSGLPNANAVGSRIDSPVAETIYYIECPATGSDTVVVKVLPEIEET